MRADRKDDRAGLAGADRSDVSLPRPFAGNPWLDPLCVNVMTGAIGAVAKEHKETPDFADFISGRMISPAAYIGTTPTALIGRAQDLARLADVLAAPEAGLVTVTGPAGVGKSRLVMEYFRQRQPGPDSAVEVLDFGQIADASVCGLMLRQLAERCKEGSRAARAVLERLGTGRHTVLLDHYEDVADELAPVLAEFRRLCPQVRIVSVGTTRLGLYGERVVRLQPLPTGNLMDAELPAVARVPAVELFVECARSVLPEFTLTAENSLPVLALCTLLGGLPFAIELAASQAKLAEPELILERFERGLSDLHRIGRHPYSRHSSINDIVSWVFGRLRDDERMLLYQLAIFQSPFTMRTAAEVVDRLDGGIYQTMERLIDKSALIPDQRNDGELSLSIPSIIRLAAARSLAQLPGCLALRRAHGEYFRAVAEGRTRRESAVAVGGGRVVGLGPDIRADLLAAFSYWRETGDGQAMAVIVSALRERCAGAGLAEQCFRLAEEVLRAGVGDQQLNARTLETAGEMATRLGFAAARGFLSQALAAYRAVHDMDGVVRCLGLLGEEAYASGDLDRARSRFEESLAVIAEADQATPTEDRVAAGDRASAARRHLSRRLAVVLREAGSLTQAGELARAALAAELGQEDPADAVLARYVLATIGWLEHDSPEARALFADVAEQVGRLPDGAELPECLEMLAISLWKWRRITDWQQLTAALGLAERLRRRLEHRRPKPLNEMITPILAAASQELTAEEYATAWWAGAELPWAATLCLVPGAEPMLVAGPEVPADIADLLTKRELEVALLVAGGLTNRVIAHKLGIAEWTVVNHLRKVMRKLECQSRVHVTRRLAAR